MESTEPLDLSEILQRDDPNDGSSNTAAIDFGDYLDDIDTDAENSTLPPSRRWIWYCKLPGCPKYYTAWSCKSNFLLHLYETSIHRVSELTETREGRRALGQAWREETAYDLSEPKKQPPAEKEKHDGQKPV